MRARDGGLGGRLVDAAELHAQRDLEREAPASFGPMPTSAVTAESLNAAPCWRATILSAEWKHAA